MFNRGRSKGSETDEAGCQAASPTEGSGDRSVLGWPVRQEAHLLPGDNQEHRVLMAGSLVPNVEMVII